MGISVKFVCHICQATFLERDQIADHYECYHQNELEQTSATNHKETPQELPGTLLQNEPSQDPQNPWNYRKKVYACSSCPSKFITRALFMQHTYEDHQEQVLGPNKPIVIKTAPGVDFSKIRKFQDPLVLVHPDPDPKIEVSKPNQDINRETTSFRGGKNVKVSSEDKQLAERAIKDLQTASTYDLVCRICDPEKTFTVYSSLLTHLRSHAGQRKFKCDQCQATFTRQHSLNYHLLVHEEKSRFTCPHCNRQFRHPTHFKEHVAKHGDVSQFGFECQFCNAAFLSAKEYRQHLWSKHNKRFDILGNEKVSKTDKRIADKILAREKKKLRGEVKTDLDAGLHQDKEPDQSLESEPSPRQSWSDYQPQLVESYNDIMINVTTNHNE